MSKRLNPTNALVAGVVLGSLITYAVYSLWLQPSGDTPGQNQAGSESQVSYWVAPMDPNYKRDKPGKSPMGMELIPVYKDNNGGSDMGPGTIKISPEVVNNLGVRTATVERKALHAVIKTVGYVQYDEDQLIHVHPRVEGWIETLYVKAAGDPVTKGQPLYEIYSPSLVNAQEELVMALGRNNQRLIKAAEDRLQALQLPNSAVKKLKQSKKVAQTIIFYAPQTGVVDNLNIREGFFVKPGTTLMSIGALDQVWVEAEVFERQAAKVAVGQAVTMSLDYLPGKEWQGTVDYLYPALDPKTRTLRVRLRFDNENEVLRPNMFAQVVIHADSLRKTLLVPREAVIRTGTVNRVVLALGEGRYKSVNVTVGQFDEQSAEILAGLEEGERIVSSAQFLLDSESSKSSDFKRKNQEDEDKTVASSAWVEATINSLMAGHRMVNATHQPISDWGWPVMTMEFTVAEAVDFSKLESGMTLHIEVRKTATGQYEIANVHIPRDEPANQNKNHKEINHEGMNDEGMNHEGMNHEGMNHKNMNHSDHNG